MEENKRKQYAHLYEHHEVEDPQPREEKDDIPMQKEACRNFAESQGWEIVKEFSEKGVSGFKKSAKDRDELQKIQQAAMEGKFDILLVFMFDRLGRRDDETPFIVEWFTKQGIRATFGYEYNNLEGIMLEKVLHNLDMPIQISSYELV